MISNIGTLSEGDQAALWSIVEFLRQRLMRTDTVDWALELTAEHRPERMAVQHLLNTQQGSELREPWMTAWRLIEESWIRQPPEARGHVHARLHRIGARLRTGDRSGGAVERIATLVTPCLRVDRRPDPLPKPGTVGDLMSARITSGQLIDLETLSLTSIDDVSFLTALANSLDGALRRGLDMSRRLGWDGEGHDWRMGRVERVAYQEQSSRSEGREPDQFHRGLAPVTKLLHAVVIRLADLDGETALGFMDGWRARPSGIHVRLWAEIARESCLVGNADVYAFLRDLEDRYFWLAGESPEIAALRSRYFDLVDDDSRRQITKRLLELPPVDLVMRVLACSAQEANVARVAWAVREWYRIKNEGVELPPAAKTWLDERLVEFPELTDMRLEGGAGQRTSTWYATLPDYSYELLAGGSRLRTLERGLLRGGDGSGARRRTRAGEWLRLPGRVELVLADVESTDMDLAEFPSVVNELCTVYAEAPQEANEAVRAEAMKDVKDVQRVLTVVEALPQATIGVAISGISDWMATWGQEVLQQQPGRRMWLRVWPVAVRATNDCDGGAEVPRQGLNGSEANRASEIIAEQASSTPVGNMVVAFLAACARVHAGTAPFAGSGELREIRDAISDADGRAETIVRYMLLRQLSWFLQADRDWTCDFLIRPLREGDAVAQELWVAIGWDAVSTEVIEVIGADVARRAADTGLPRETRCSLACSVVLVWLQAALDERDPPVPQAEVQQMLRLVEDEVRVAAARVVAWRVKEWAGAGDRERGFDKVALQKTIGRFFREVWPQEQSLATPGVSEALATMPAVAGEDFAEMVDIIDRFLVPFPCWDMGTYNLYADDGDRDKFSVIDDETKADALLRLLDKTVGYAEDATVPYDLSYALERIRSVSPSAAERSTFRRLAATSRR